MKYAAISTLALSLLYQNAAHAEDQMEGSITARSDVKMSVDGALGTGGERLDALAEHLGTPLTEMKRCYANIVKSDPSMTGTLYVNVELGKRGPMRVTPLGGRAVSHKMRSCVQGAFRTLTSRNLQRPLRARIALELSNTAAEMVPEVRANAEEASRVAVNTDTDGRSYSEGRSLDGEVGFRISAKGRDASSVVERIHTAVRDSLPSLFDCRRKSAKDGSPEGDIALDVGLGGGDAQIQVRSNTVNSKRATPCVDRAMTRGLSGLGWGRAKVELHFTPLKDSPGDASD